MAKTKRDKVRGRYKQHCRQHDKEHKKYVRKLKAQGWDWYVAHKEAVRVVPSGWDRLTVEEKRILENDYAKSPSWWNHLFNNAPKKAETRNMLKKIDLQTECDDLVFPDDNKPHLYYW